MVVFGEIVDPDGSVYALTAARKSLGLFSKRMSEPGKVLVMSSQPRRGLFLRECGW
jgi:hypothetical protein